MIGRWLPLGLAYLAGSTRAAGFEALIFDARSSGHGLSEIEQYLRSTDAAYVATTAITSTLNDAVTILELAKRINPQVTTIVGGVHPTLCCEEVLTSTSAVDFIVCGEGEVTLVELLQSLEKSADPADLPGVAFVRDGAVFKTVLREPICNLDELTVAWDLLDWSLYQYFVLPGSRLGVINGSRPSVAGNSTVIRYRDPSRVVDEIAHLHLAYGVDVILLTDEFPTSDRDRFELFLDLLIARNLSSRLLMQTSIGDIIRDRDILEKYRKAGIIHIYMAIDTSDVKSDDFSTINTIATAKSALNSLREHGIISEASFVVGGVDETGSGLERTLKLSQYCNPDNAQFLPFTPWPGEGSYDDLRQYIKVNDYEKFNLIDPVVEPKQLSLKQVNDAIMHFHRRFYMGKMIDLVTMKDVFKRDYLMKAMKLMMSSPFILQKIGMGPFSKVPTKIREIMNKEIF